MINLSSKEISSTSGAIWPFSSAAPVLKYACECTHPEWFHILETPPAVNGTRVKAGEDLCRKYNAAAAVGTVCIFASYYENKKGEIFGAKLVNCSTVTGIAKTSETND